jgi:hypothetical protein
MEQSDAALEAFLGLRRAGIGEGDGSKLFRRRRLVMGTRARRRSEQCKQQKTGQGAADHDGLHFLLRGYHTRPGRSLCPDNATHQ